MANDSADVTSSGRSFHVCGPATGKARLPTVDSLLVGTTRRLVPSERSNRRLGRSATRVKGPSYPGASPWTTSYVNTAILNYSPVGPFRRTFVCFRDMVIFVIFLCGVIIGE